MDNKDEKFYDVEYIEDSVQRKLTWLTLSEAAIVSEDLQFDDWITDVKIVER